MREKIDKLKNKILVEEEFQNSRNLGICFVVFRDRKVASKFKENNYFVLAVCLLSSFVPFNVQKNSQILKTVTFCYEPIKTHSSAF